MKEKHTCKICLNEAEQLQRHLTIKHNAMTLNYYLEKFKCGEEYQEIYEKIRQKRTKNSPWSVDFYTNRGFSEGEAKNIISEKILVKNSKRNTTPNQIEHWIKKGYDALSAEERVKKYKKDIGSVPTLDKLIVKYGKRIGNEKWNEYCLKIKNRQQVFLNKVSSNLIEANLIRWFKTSLTENGAIVRKYTFEDYKSYLGAVATATKISISLYGNEIDDIERNKLGITHAKNGYALDHKYSKYGGFLNKIHPLVIGSKSNLALLAKEENSRKGQYCSISLDEINSYKTVLDDETISLELRKKVSEIFIEEKKDK